MTKKQRDTLVGLIADYALDCMEFGESRRKEDNEKCNESYKRLIKYLDSLIERW